MVKVLPTVPCSEGSENFPEAVPVIAEIPLVLPSSERRRKLGTTGTTVWFTVEYCHHLASIIRSPTPLAQPVDWNPVFNHGVATDTTVIPFSSSSESYIDPIDYALCRVYLSSEVSDIIREGLQLGLQQRAEAECREQIWQRVLEARARIEKRLNCEVRLPPCDHRLPNPILCHWFRGNPPLPALRNHISPLWPRQSLRIPAHYREVYTRH